VTRSAGISTDYRCAGTHCIGGEWVRRGMYSRTQCCMTLPMARTTVGGGYNVARAGGHLAAVAEDNGYHPHLPERAADVQPLGSTPPPVLYRHLEDCRQYEVIRLRISMHRIFRHACCSVDWANAHAHPSRIDPNTTPSVLYGQSHSPTTTSTAASAPVAEHCRVDLIYGM
jgi:hypothetical protein